MKSYKKQIHNQWQRQYDLLDKYKIKEKLGIWETSFQSNRNREVKLARIRMGCVKGIHITPRIEGTYPIVCNCDGSFLSLKHIFFDCNYYINERLPIIGTLRENELNCNLKDLLSDNEEVVDEIFKFLTKIDFLKEI